MIATDETDKKLPNLEQLASQYAAKARQIDDILDKLTKDYCANNCCYAPEGCCNADHYEQGIDFSLRALFKNIHEQESKDKIPSDRKPQSACDYHTSQGCTLKTKSPVCLGYMCDKLSDHVIAKHRSEKVEHHAFSFVNSMDRFHAVKLSVHDFPRLFYYMDKAIESGIILVEFEKGRWQG